MLYIALCILMSGLSSHVIVLLCIVCTGHPSGSQGQGVDNIHQLPEFANDLELNPRSQRPGIAAARLVLKQIWLHYNTLC